LSSASRQKVEDILSRVSFSEQLLQGIRGAELVVLKRCGHGLPTESSEATAAAVLGFLSRNLFFSE
jgi:pimeloyl-ACP methyl ester carboxylesterase